MKVRIRKTGEVKTISDYSRIQVEDCDSWGNPLEYKLDEIEIVSDDLTCGKDTGIDWEKVRINAAIAAMPLANTIVDGLNRF